MLALRYNKVFLALLGLLAILALHNYLALPSGTKLWASFRDAMHVPMFVLVATLFWWVVPPLPLRLRALSTFIGCILFAGATELIQMFRAVGTASVMDIAVDLAASALTIAAWCIWIPPLQRERWKRNASITALLGLLVLLASFPVAMARTTYAHLSSIYPELVDYAAVNPLMLHACRSTCTVINFQPKAATPSHGLLVTFEGFSWPGVNLVEVLAPVSIYEQLEVDFELLGDEPMDLFIIAHPSNKREQAQKVQRRIQPGDQSLRLYLKQILSRDSNAKSLRLGLFTSSDHLSQQLIIKAIRYTP